MTKKGSNLENKKGSILTWFRIAAILPFIPIIIVSWALSLWTDSNLGIFYLAGYSLLIVSAWYAILSAYARHHLANGRCRTSLILLAVLLCIILVVTIWPIDYYVRSGQNAFVTKYHSYNQTDPAQMYQLQKFMNNTMIYGNESLEVMDGYNINLRLSEDPMFHGILGIIYGGAAMIVTCIGWCSRPIGNGGNSRKNCPERMKETEIAKVIFNFNIVLSIIFAVVIFAAGNPILMSSVRYVFIAMSFILAVLLFTLGFLVSSESGANGTPFQGRLMALVISFTIGFVVGNMAFPITRVPLGTFGDNKTLYGVYPGQYVFMCASMFAIAFLVLMLMNHQASHQQPPAKVAALQESAAEQLGKKAVKQPEGKNKPRKPRNPKKKEEKVRGFKEQASGGVIHSVGEGEGGLG